jgi:hypothetical protein
MSWLSDLFKSKAERTRDVKRMQMQKMRDVDRALERMKDLTKQHSERRTNAFLSAQNHMRANDKFGAKRELFKVRMHETVIRNMDSRIAIIEYRRSVLETAQAGDDALAGLTSLAAMADIDPSKIEDMLLQVDSVTDQAAEVDSIFERQFARDMERVGMKQVEGIETVDQMFANLEASVLGAAANPVTLNAPAYDADRNAAEIGKLREQK